MDKIMEMGEKIFRRFKVELLLGAFISILLILTAIYFTPDFIANNFSPDGILEQSTKAKINIIRLNFSILVAIGLLIFAIFLIKPKLLSSSADQFSKIPLIIQGLFLIDFSLCFIHMPTQLLPNEYSRYFDLDKEANIPAWYSSIKLFSISLLSGLIAYYKFNRSSLISRTILLLPLIFLALSIDESAAIHEHVAYAVDSLVLSSTRDVTIFSKTGIWMFGLGIPFITVFFMLMITIKKHFDKKSYTLIFSGMIIFLSGALGLETMANFVPVEFLFIQEFWEEFIELIGVTIIFWGFYQSTEFYWHRLLIKEDEIRPSQDNGHI